MANVTTDARSDLYGHSDLYGSISYGIANLWSPSGSTAMPVGHNPENRTQGLCYDLGPGNFTPGHSLWFGATRSGKGVSSIIPSLLTYMGSVLAIDPKGELAWITARRRREMGQRVVILDPWNEVNERYASKLGQTETLTTFNPLSALDPKDRDFNDDVSAIADALIVVDPNDPQSHWITSARSCIAGLIAAAIEDKGKQASLRDVRQLVTSSDEYLLQHIHRIVKANPDSLAGRKLRRFAVTDKDGNAVVTPEISGIRSTAETQTDLLDSEALLASMETHTPPFELVELLNSQTTVYLVLPPDRLSTHGRWLRTIITMALRVIARQRKPPLLPVWFCLDEMGTIGPLRMVEDSYGLLAGMGVRLSGYLQNLSQLKRDYPANWNTFLSNSSIIGILQCNDTETASYVSEYLGTKTIEVNQGESMHIRPAHNAEQRNSPKGNLIRGAIAGAAGQMGGDVQQQHRQSLQREVWEPDLSFHPRQVLLPYEVMQSPADEVIVLWSGHENFRLKRFVYYTDPVLSQWARPDPNIPVAAPAPAVAAADPAPAPAPSKAQHSIPPIDLHDVGKQAAEAGKKLVGGLLDRLNKH